MNLTVESTKNLNGIVKVPSSKSYTIRALIGGLLANGESIIKEPLYSDDTDACIKMCSQLGAKITKKKDSIVITGTSGTLKVPKNILDSMNSGTTIRIMTAIASLCNKEITLTGDESIQKRPIGHLLNALSQLGVKTSSKNGYPPLKVKGPIQGGKCSIPGDVSSQFISALLMAVPCARKDTTIEITTGLKSKPYVDMTLDTLKAFRIKVENQNYRRFWMRGKQLYKAKEYTVEGDYSSAAFILGAGALVRSNIAINNLFRNSKQADKKIIEILERMGVRVNVYFDSVTIEGDGRLRGIHMDLGDSPDLLPIVSVLGALANGSTVIENVEHARLKECDRIHAMTSELIKMGAHIEEKYDGMIIHGVPELYGTEVSGHKDHRVVMALAVAGLRAVGNTAITDKEYVSVTFPDFIKIMKNLGAKIY